MGQSLASPGLILDCSSSTQGLGSLHDADSQAFWQGKWPLN